MLTDLRPLVGAALVVNFGVVVVELVIPVVNFVEIVAEGRIARSLPGPLVGVGLRNKVLDAEVVRIEDFVGILPVLWLLPFHVAALTTRIGVVVGM